MKLERFTVTFEKSKNGGVFAIINGKASFPEHEQDQTAEIGEAWEVVISGDNSPKRTVNFVLLVRKVSSSDRRPGHNRTREHSRDGHNRHSSDRMGKS